MRMYLPCDERSPLGQLVMILLGHECAKHVAVEPLEAELLA